MVIPRTVYTYWDCTPPPSLVRFCLRIMKKHNPDWTVRVLGPEDEENVPGAQDDMPLSPQHRSDWVRVCYIARHGGVWLDASCICTEPLEASWIDVNSSALHGFETPSNNGIMENWAFAAPAGHPVMLLWKEELARARLAGFAAYCSAAPQEITQKIGERMLPYLTAHVALAQARRRTHAAATTVVLTQSSTGPRGPYEYLAAVNWAPVPAILLLWAKNPYLLVWRLAGVPGGPGGPSSSSSSSSSRLQRGPPFWKLRGGDRSAWIYMEMLVAAIAIAIILGLSAMMMVRGRRRCVATI